MIRENGARFHPEFDLEFARQIYAGCRLDEDPTVDSPFGLYSVEAARDRDGLRLGRAHPTDVFVFGRGEPAARTATKIGGIPYWPRSRSWPVDDAGNPLRFLAQFNFSDSRDLLPSLPGDVLLLLVSGVGESDDLDWLGDSEPVHFEWLPAALEPVESFDRELLATKSGPFFGTIHRSADYPESRAASVASRLSIMEATKIGGRPFFIHGGELTDDVFVCQLSCVAGHPDAPYPWVNEERPIGLWSEEVNSPENGFMLFDTGSLYVYLTRDGRTRSFFECY